MKKILNAALLQLCVCLTACGLPDEGGGIGQLRVSFEGDDLPVPCRPAIKDYQRNVWLY